MQARFLPSAPIAVLLCVFLVPDLPETGGGSVVVYRVFLKGAFKVCGTIGGRVNFIVPCYWDNY